MHRNFTMDASGIVLSTSLGDFDVHNIYGLRSVTYKPDARVLTCAFQKVYPPAVVSHESFALRFEGVTFVEIVHAGEPTTDDGTVEELGFKEAGDADLDWLVPHREPVVEPHLVIRMSSGGHIRVCASQANVVLSG